MSRPKQSLVSALMARACLSFLPLPAWRAMSSPRYPTREQLALLRKSAEIAPAKVMKVNARGRLVLDLALEGLALLELS